MADKDPERLVYSVAEAGKLLNLSRGSTYEGIRTGQIPSVKIGRRILVPRAALDRLLEGTGTNNTFLKS